MRIFYSLSIPIATRILFQMEKRSRRPAARSYNSNQKTMRAKTSAPIDALLREHLRPRVAHQQNVAKQIGRSQGWLNKYLNGAGKASVDDLIRLIAVVVHGLGAAAPVTAAQRRLLKSWDRLSPQGRKAVAAVFAAERQFQRERRARLAEPRDPGPAATNKGKTHKRRSD